jgi:hypothetical protein
VVLLLQPATGSGVPEQGFQYFYIYIYIGQVGVALAAKHRLGDSRTGLPILLYLHVIGWFPKL